MFEVIEKLPYDSRILHHGYNPHSMIFRTTEHGNERLRGRMREFQARGGHVGTRFDYAFLVDTGHENGLEIHAITDTGCIFIFNNRTHKLITVLFARPSQIRRYFSNGHAPRRLMDYAREYKAKGLNEL